jgi:hypothetical protein
MKNVMSFFVICAKTEIVLETVNVKIWNLCFGNIMAKPIIKSGPNAVLAVRHGFASKQVVIPSFAISAN